MKIRMLVSMSGMDFSLSLGEETERFEQAEAERLIAAGFAVPADEIVRETAVKKSAREERG